MNHLVDLMRIAFFGVATVLTGQMMQKLGTYKMTIIDLPMNLVYGVVMAGFAAMCLRAMWVMKIHWQRGYTVLQRPESEMTDR
jgi:TRAP-type C4-dicarboxylate transport system permease small subunit